MQIRQRFTCYSLDLVARLDVLVFAIGSNPTQFTKFRCIGKLSLYGCIYSFRRQRSLRQRIRDNRLQTSHRVMTDVWNRDWNGYSLRVQAAEERDDKV